MTTTPHPAVKLADLLIDLKRYEEARELLARRIAVDPESSDGGVPGCAAKPITDFDTVVSREAVMPESVSMRTWWLVEYRFCDCSAMAMAWSRVGTRAPSTISTASLASLLRGWKASIGPRLMAGFPVTGSPIHPHLDRAPRNTARRPVPAGALHF